MWHTENRIPRYKPHTTIKSIHKFSALRLKRSGQDTGYGERMHACKTKASHLSAGPTTVVGIVKTLDSVNGSLSYRNQQSVSTSQLVLAF